MIKKLAVLAIGMALSSAASANLILGGGFNDPTDLDFWTNTSQDGGGIAVTIGTAFGLGPQEGAGYLAFTGNSSTVPGDWYGGLYQEVNLNTGSKYRLTYFTGGRGQNTSDTLVEVGMTEGFFGSGDAFENVYQTNTPIGVWTKRVVEFVADTNFLFLDLAEVSANSQNAGPAIDDISLVEIPVPGTLALIGSALLGFGAYKRRRS